MMPCPRNMELQDLARLASEAALILDCLSRGDEQIENGKSILDLAQYINKEFEPRESELDPKQVLIFSDALRAQAVMRYRKEVKQAAISLAEDLKNYNLLPKARQAALRDTAVAISKQAMRYDPIF